MNHQPFEDWLLEDKTLTREEKREMDSHLRNCPRCSSISETGFALRAARVISPAPGFAARFQTRLAAQKIVERRKRLWGTFLLTFAAVGLFAGFSAPYIYAIATSPAEWLTTAVGYFLFIVTSLQVVTEMFSVFAKIIPNILPPYAWMVFASALAGFSLLWAVSIWRVSHAPKGVSA